MFGTGQSRFWRVLTAGLLLSVLVPSTLLGAEEPTVEEMKERIANAAIADRPPLCLQVSERQLGAVGRFYDLGDSEQAKVALTDVVAFSELARDYAIQSHKHEKQSEIAIRRMIR